jgi:hypothetical protein
MNGTAALNRGAKRSAVGRADRSTTKALSRISAPWHHFRHATCFRPRGACQPTGAPPAFQV